MCKRKKDERPLAPSEEYDEDLQDIQDDYLDIPKDTNETKNKSTEEKNEKQSENGDCWELERLKIAYDIRKQELLQQNKLLQLLLGLAASFFGVFEITLCLCRNTALSWVDIVFSLVGIYLFVWAIIFIAKGLRCSDDKELEDRLKKAKNLMGLKDFMKHYIDRISELTKVVSIKKIYVKKATVSTITLGVYAVIYEILVLVMNLIPLVG